MTDAASQADPSQPQDETLLAELERVQAQLDQVREHLTHTHRLATLGTLTSVVAHEYNNVLTPVINYARLALNESSDPALMRKALQKCLEGAERATKISHSLLGFSSQDDAPTEANLNETAQEAVACLGRDPAKDGIDLHTHMPDAAAAISPLSLQQVLVNLMLNAKKAMRRKGGRLTLRGQVTDDRRHITLEVADTGPGIPQAIRDHLFEPFVTQAHEPHEPTTDKTGTGLGLCICRDLVQNAGGQIDVQSTPGHGTSFTLTLPLAAASAAKSQDAQDAQDAEAAQQLAPLNQPATTHRAAG
jgi:signal transduction histidine kinase